MKTWYRCTSVCFIAFGLISLYWLYKYIGNDTGILLGIYDGVPDFSRNSPGSIAGIDEGLGVAFFFVLPAIARLLRLTRPLSTMEFAVGSLVFGATSLVIGSIGGNYVEATVTYVDDRYLAKFLLMYLLSAILFVVLATGYMWRTFSALKS